MKRRDRGPTPYSMRAKESGVAVGVLKRTLRRLQRGQQIPFLVATIEPTADSTGRLVAAPAVLSLGLDQQECRYLVSALLKHLADVGALQVREKPLPGTNALDDMNEIPAPVNEETPG